LRIEACPKDSTVKCKFDANEYDLDGKVTPNVKSTFVESQGA